MKKYDKFIILLFTLTLSFLLMIEYKETKAAGEDALTAYAYELRVVRYKGAGSSKEYINVDPILIYHPSMLNDISGYQLSGAGHIPTDPEQFYTGESFDIAPVSYLDGFLSDVWNTITGGAPGETRQETGITVNGVELFGAGAQSVFGETHVPTTGDNTIYADLGVVNAGAQSFLYTDKKDVGPYNNVESMDPKSGKTGYKVKTYVYYTKAMTVSYPASRISYDVYYQKKFSDSNLTQSSVENGYVDTLLRRYGGTKDRIEANFGYTVGQEEYPYIYVEAIPVHRVIEKSSSKLTRKGTYVVSELEKEVRKEGEWDEGNWSKSGLTCDTAGAFVSGGYCYTTWGRTVDHPSDCDGYIDSCLHEDERTGTKADCWCVTNYKHEKAHYHYSLPKIEVGKKIRYEMLGSYMEGPSYIKSSATTGEFLERAYDPCSINYHEKTGNSNIDESGYYIGPDKDNALVGVSNKNPHQLSGSCSTLSGTIGMQHIWLEYSEEHPIDPNPTSPSPDGCKIACEATNKNAEYFKSDEYLKCAENYCDYYVNKDLDNINSRNNKRDCILQKCGYVYGEIPPGGGEEDRQSVNSCANSKSPYSSVTRDLTSTCNKDNSSGKSVSNLTGVTVEDCVGDLVKDFHRDTNGRVVETAEITRFDVRTYINKVCKEEVNFEFKDLQSEELPVAGTGFTYPIVEYGNRKCTYYFNLEQWKFDYASVPSRQPLKRKRLLYILEQFNQATIDENQRTKNNYDPEFIAQYDDDVSTFGQLNHKVEGFDFANSSVGVNIEEKLIDNSIATPTSQVIVKTEAKDGMKTSPTLSAVKTNDVVKIIENFTINTATAKQFETNAPGTVKYGLQKVCVSTDGNATVSVAPGNGICGTNEKGTIYGENKHYTSFKIKLDNQNPVKTNVTVKSSKDQVTYYSDKETCTYSISSKTNDDKFCRLTMQVTEGTKISATEAFADQVTVNMIYEVPTSPTSVSIVDKIKNNGSRPETRTDGETATVVRTNNRHDEVHELTGEVTYKDFDGVTQTVPCPLTITLRKKGGTCGLDCVIEKVDDNNYAIKSTGSTNPTYWNYYINTKAKYSLDYTFPTKIVPTRYVNNKPVSDVALSSSLEDGDILIGFIRTDNENCNALCPYPASTSTKPDCTKMFDPAERDDIYNYCTDDEKRSLDINDYVDDNDCIRHCGHMCQNDKCDKNKAISHCENDNWKKYGFLSETSCMHECYRDCSIPQGDTYLFRTVDITNPFPDSQESEYPYEKGKRIVGANWNQYSGYITYDEEDTTTITGPNANSQVEYIIDLTPEDIRKIRQDTESSDLNNLKRKRAVYAKLDRVKTGSGTIKEYKSNFLHKSQFVSLFKSSHGSTVSTFTP